MTLSYFVGGVYVCLTLTMLILVAPAISCRYHWTEVEEESINSGKLSVGSCFMNAAHAMVHSQCIDMLSI